jgi:hypothetical protein
MHCPRCGGDLASFTIEEAARTAVACENCGFADTPASHRPDGDDPESWDEAVSRFENAPQRNRTCRTVRLDGAPTPASDNETDAAIDPDRLDETVTVATTLHAAERREDAPERESTDPSE